MAQTTDAFLSRITQEADGKLRVDILGTPGDTVIGGIAAYRNAGGAFSVVLNVSIPGSNTTGSKVLVAGDHTVTPGDFSDTITLGASGKLTVLCTPTSTDQIVGVAYSRTTANYEFWRLSGTAIPPVAGTPSHLVNKEPTPLGVTVLKGEIAHLRGTGTPAQRSNFTWGKGDPAAGEFTYTLVPPEPEPEPEPVEEPPDATELGKEISLFLTGRFDDPDLVQTCSQAGELVKTMARVYTRGNGFTYQEPNTDIRKVIIAAAARLAANPDQLQSQVGSAVMRGQFDGWNDLERIILGGYRKQAG